MCQFKSAIVVKDEREKNGFRLLMSPATESHSELEQHFKLKDGARLNYAKVEFSPKDFSTAHRVETYKLYIDEARTPDWFDEEIKTKVIEKMISYVKTLIVNDERKTLDGGQWILGPKSKIGIAKNVVINFLNGGTITNFEGGTIVNFNGGTITNFKGGTIITQLVGGTITNFEGGTIANFDDGTIANFDDGTIDHFWSGTITCFYNGTIRHFDTGTIINLNGGTITNFKGGTIDHFWGGTVDHFWGGTITNLRGGTINTLMGGTIDHFNYGTIVKDYRKSRFDNVL